MFGIKTSLTIGLLMLVLNVAVFGACGAAQSRGGRNKSKPAKNHGVPATRATPTPKSEGGDVPNDELKEIAGGGYSSVEDAFVAVVRDAETYAALGKAVGELPALDADFFKTRAIVAAFLGTRRSGGYAVKITRGADGAFRVGETTPPKGAMTTQALTSPFRVVSVATSGEAGVSLELDESWKKSLRAYNVTDGEFTVSGGLAGRIDKFKLEGALRVSRLDKLVTIFFDLRSADKGAGGRTRTLQTVATGTSDKNGAIQLSGLRDASLVNWSSSGLRARGLWNADTSELSLSFESLPSRIADGFIGQGRLTAVSTATEDHNNPRGGKVPPE